MREESTEALSGRTLECATESIVRQPRIAVFAGYDTRKHRSHGAVGIVNREFEFYRHLILDGRVSTADNLAVKHIGNVMLLLGHVDYGIGLGLFRHVKELAEIKVRSLEGVMVGLDMEHVGASDNLVKAADTYFGKSLADFLGEELEEVNHILAAPSETLAKFLVLGRYSDRACVHMALAHHHASEHDKCTCGETELLGTEHCHYNHVTRTLELTVSLELHLTAKVVDDKGLLCLCQTYLHRQTGIADRTCRRCARTAIAAADGNKVALGLCHTCRDGTHSALADELDRDIRLGVDILEVENQLGKVLDGIDVMVRGRRYEGDAGYGVTCLGDNLVDLESGELATFTGLGTLGYLNLDFIGVDKILSRDTEAA